MPIVSVTYTKAGTFLGMPLIVEQGIATNDESTLRLITRHETGRVEFVPLPRTTGLSAKALDGQTISTTDLQTELFGLFRNCIQLGKSQIVRLAPRQPIGPHVGKEIVSYQRQWVQLTASE